MARNRPLYTCVTAKLARDLSMRQLGTARGLKKSEAFPDRHELRMGSLIIEIRPSYSEPGLVELNVRMNCQVGDTFFFHPDTLEPDFDADEREKLRQKRSFLEEWVSTFEDPERCKAEIDRIWNRR